MALPPLNLPSHPTSSPLDEIPQGPFDIIVAELAKRLRPDPTTVFTTDADALCRDVAKACRELRTLKLLPNQTLDELADCSDPNSPVWVAALVIFGLDGREGLPLEYRPFIGKSWWRNDPVFVTHKDNFFALCRAFDPKFKIELEPWRTGTARVKMVWAYLWRAVQMRAQLEPQFYIANEPHYAYPTKQQLREFQWEVRRPRFWSWLGERPLTERNNEWLEEHSTGQYHDAGRVIERLIELQYLVAGWREGDPKLATEEEVLQLLESDPERAAVREANETQLFQLDRLFRFVRLQMRAMTALYGRPPRRFT